ncbi:MAG TPA: MurR/RpiR family transcriptional regulator [Acidimicrobiales bacterium]|nr:MurR/RpiR family transcriptional regulator [Acidimicrobiales bacterium]
MSVASTIEQYRDVLGPAERRVAAVVLADAEAIAFGTVASVATASGASGASVVRLATRLGYDGFVGLQSAVQAELATRLRPAAERIRQPAAVDVVGRTLATELDNVHRTLDAVQPRTFSTAVRLLATRSSTVAVVSGEASVGVATMFAGELAMLRPRVSLVSGSEVATARAVGLLEPADVVVALDVRRYDRAVLAAADEAVRRGAVVIAVTDSPLSPLADGAAAAFAVAAEGAGPFDSHVGMLALANALVTAVAARLRAGATARLDRVEAAWRMSGALVD